MLGAHRDSDSYEPDSADGVNVENASLDKPRVHLLSRLCHLKTRSKHRAYTQQEGRHTCGWSTRIRLIANSRSSSVNSLLRSGSSGKMKIRMMPSPMVRIPSTRKMFLQPSTLPILPTESRPAAIKPPKAPASPAATSMKHP